MDKPIPKLLYYAQQTYEALDGAAITMSIDGQEVEVFQGHTTVFLEKEIGLSPSRYGRIMKCLTELGCVIQHKRGAGNNTQSEWVLIGPPTSDAFAEWRHRQGKRVYNLDLKEEQIKGLRRELNNLKARVATLESKLGVRDGQD